MNSGFNADIINILKSNNLFHSESLGLLVGVSTDGKMGNLLYILFSYNLNVTGNFEAYFDYIVVPSSYSSIRTLVKCLTSLSNCGIIILELSDNNRKYENKYRNMIGNFSAVKVVYENRAYLIIKLGEDYGN